MYQFIRPLLFSYNAQEIHKKSIEVGKKLKRLRVSRIIKAVYNFQDKGLMARVKGIDFRNPVGLAAGFDKNGELTDFLDCLGFGFIEIGSITALPKKADNKNTIERIVEEKAIVNRMGLNNNGADEIYDRLKEKNFKIPLGINIAPTNYTTILQDRAIKDICYSFGRLYSLADYITINISCPNTEDARSFEDKLALDELLSALKEKQQDFKNKKPILVKISPDVSYQSLDNILNIGESKGITGYVIGNTSSQTNCLKRDPLISGKFGISGKPIREMSTGLISYAYKNLNNPFIIGVGGIFSAEDAYEKIKAGASIIQVYTGLIYEGPGMINKINKGLVRLLERDGLGSIKEAVGIDSK